MTAARILPLSIRGCEEPLRCLVISALGFVYTFLQSMDIDLLSQAICGAAQMMKVVCEPGMIVGTLKAIMAWLALGLAIEDKTK